MIRRELFNLIQNRLERYPAVCMVGPRQCGKTTLARAFGGSYFDLEVEADRFKLDAQWPETAASDKLVILDEAQEMGEIFPRLRSEIDKDRKRMGRFLFLGSVSPALMTKVSESLAGRLGLVELTPFLRHEVADKSLDELWFYGGYPDGGILSPQDYLTWQKNYLTILTQRDLPQWGLPAKALTIERMLKMVAAIHGQNWNATQIGKSLGLNYQTVNSYLEYIRGSFLVRLLLPYSANLTKRFRKAPKVYWRDSGLLHGMLGVENLDDLFTRPWVGASWEGFVIEQILNRLGSLGVHFDAYYLRTSDQYEIELILELGRRKVAMEVKLTSSPDTKDARRFQHAAEIIDADECILVSRTAETIRGENILSTNLDGAMEYLAELAG